MHNNNAQNKRHKIFGCKILVKVSGRQSPCLPKKNTKLPLKK